MVFNPLFCLMFTELNSVHGRSAVLHVCARYIIKTSTNIGLHRPIFLSLHRSLWNLCIVHSPTNAILLNLEKFKIYIKRHINIAPTCFGLQPSSGSLYKAWQNYVSFKTLSKITSLYIMRRCGSTLPHLRMIYNDVILLSVLTEMYS